MPPGTPCSVRSRRALRRVVRDSDYAVRYGGEEFLIVLTNSNVDGAMRVAQAVQAAMAELRAPTSEMKRVTASIGVAVFPDHGQQLDDVVAAADLAMYQAKRDGRDRIAIAPHPLSAVTGTTRHIVLGTGTLVRSSAETRARRRASRGRRCAAPSFGRCARR